MFRVCKRLKCAFNGCQAALPINIKTVTSQGYGKKLGSAEVNVIYFNGCLHDQEIIQIAKAALKETLRD